MNMQKLQQELRTLSREGKIDEFGMGPESGSFIVAGDATQFELHNGVLTVGGVVRKTLAAHFKAVEETDEASEDE